MSDAAYVQLVCERLDAVIQAWLTYQGENTVAQRKGLEAIVKVALPQISTRLDNLARTHLRTDAGEYGDKLQTDLRELARGPANGDERFRRIHIRYDRLLQLKDLVGENKIEAYAETQFSDVEFVALEYLVKTLNDGQSYVVREWVESQLEPIGAKGQAIAILRYFAELGMVKETVFDPLAGTSADKSPVRSAFRKTRWEITGKAIAVLREVNQKPATAANVVPQPAATAPPTGANAAEGTDDAKKTLSPSRHKAYALIEWAVQQNAGLADKTDREVYDWLKTKPDHASDLPPNADTFSRYLAAARRHHGTQKHLPRSGRAKGKSVVDQNQI